jgi:hypothetical protein
MAFVLWWTLSLLTHLAQIWCNKHQWRYHMKRWWLPRKRHNHTLNEHQEMSSFLSMYWYVWMSSFSFWFIHDLLCTNCYRTSSTIFLNPLNAHFPLSIHNLAMCVSHSDFSMGCYTWSKFFISSTHHNQCTFVTSWFVVDNYFLILSLYYHWLSFRSLGSYLHMIFFFKFLVDCLVLFFLWVVYSCSLLPCMFNGWVFVLDLFLYKVFLLYNIPTFVKGLNHCLANMYIVHILWHFKHQTNLMID